MGAWIRVRDNRGYVPVGGGQLGLTLGFGMGEGIMYRGGACEGWLNRSAGLAGGVYGLVLFGGGRCASGVQPTRMPLYTAVA